MYVECWNPVAEFREGLELEGTGRRRGKESGVGNKRRKETQAQMLTTDRRKNVIGDRQRHRCFSKQIAAPASKRELGVTQNNFVDRDRSVAKPPTNL